ncbi:protein transport protein bet1 [Coemansia erecta]|uniref:Protein transport protein bet1 n=1 Tax=Coemansia erecta TaxID=147472 RepID=A0A9W8CPJ7_9FUNG|nr:protein transport protein bet1 [Coemansia erecta]
MSAYNNSNSNNRLRHQTGPGAGYRSTLPGGLPGSGSSFQNQFEDENDPNAKDSRLRNKISMLKEVSISIGDEIRDQNTFLTTMGDDMEGMGTRLAKTMKNFYEMWARQGCGPFFYLTLFALGVFVFLYFYLKVR